MKNYDVYIRMEVSARDQETAENIAHDIFFYGEPEAKCKNDGHVVFYDVKSGEHV